MRRCPGLEGRRWGRAPHTSSAWRVKLGTRSRGDDVEMKWLEASLFLNDCIIGDGLRSADSEKYIYIVYVIICYRQLK